jgi:hypothetical protein
MVQLLQNLAHEFADFAQGMVRGYPLLRMNVRKHPACILRPSAHLQSSRRIRGELNHHSFALARFFSKLLEAFDLLRGTITNDQIRRDRFFELISSVHVRLGINLIATQRIVCNALVEEAKLIAAQGGPRDMRISIEGGLPELPMGPNDHPVIMPNFNFNGNGSYAIEKNVPLPAEPSTSSKR